MKSGSIRKRSRTVWIWIGVGGIIGPGDTLEMRDEVVYVNGRAQPWPAESETYFDVITNGQPIDEASVKAQYGLDISNADEVQPLGANEFDMLLTWKAREKMLKDGFDELHHWTRDNYGPLGIPTKGAALQLTTLNYPIYKRIISTYEGNKLEMRGGKIYINDTIPTGSAVQNRLDR